MPQPYLVPVRPAFSRIAQSSGVSGSTSSVKVFPLIVRFAIASPLIGPIHRSDSRAQCVWQIGTVQINSPRGGQQRGWHARGRMSGARCCVVNGGANPQPLVASNSFDYLRVLYNLWFDGSLVHPKGELPWAASSRSISKKFSRQVTISKPSHRPECYYPRRSAQPRQRRQQGPGLLSEQRWRTARRPDGVHAAEQAGHA